MDFNKIKQYEMIDVDDVYEYLVELLGDEPVYHGETGLDRLAEDVNDLMQSDDWELCVVTDEDGFTKEMWMREI